MLGVTGWLHESRRSWLIQRAARWKPLVQPEGGGASSALQKQEVGWLVSAQVEDGTLLAALGDLGVEHGEGLGVKWHGAFGAELAERHPQPDPVAGEVEQAVQFEVQQLPDMAEEVRRPRARPARMSSS